MHAITQPTALKANRKVTLTKIEIQTRGRGSKRTKKREKKIKGKNEGKKGKYVRAKNKAKKKPKQ